MNQELTVLKDPEDQQWKVRTSTGAIVAQCNSESLAIREAESHLAHGGGILLTGDRVRFVPSKRSDLEPEALRAQPPVFPGQLTPTGPTPPTTSQVREGLVNLLENGASTADTILGRESPADPILDEVGSIPVDRVFRNSVKLTMINRHVTTGAAVVAALALVFGGGSVSGVVTPLVQSAAGKATVGSYISFVDAFFLTFALSVATAIVVVAVRSNRLTHYPLAAVAIMACIGSVVLAQKLGLSGPSLNEMQEGMGYANPIAQAIGGFSVFLAFYGPVPFAAGVVVGGLAGNIAYNLLEPAVN